MHPQEVARDRLVITETMVRAVSRLPTIGIDVGASKIAAGVVDEHGKVLHRLEQQRTPSSHTGGLVDTLACMVRALTDAMPVCAVGVGTAGLVTWPDGEIEFAANHGHRKLKLRRNLAAAISSDAVVVENDANAAAWGEFRTGSYTPDQGLLFLAIGTGLGSGFVANEQLVRGQNGRGAEIGHLVVDRSSSLECPCGLFGCLEALVSGNALARLGKRKIADSPDGSLARRFGGRVKQADTPAMINAACAGDPEAVGIIHRMGELLGRTIGESVMSLFPAQSVVVGGGLSRLDTLLLTPMRRSCDKVLANSKCFSPPRFTLSRLGADAILVGAALRAGEEAMQTDNVATSIKAPRRRAISADGTSRSAPPLGAPNLVKA